MPVQCVCQNPLCGKPFLVPDQALSRGRGRFCSRRCTQTVFRKPKRIHPQALCENPACGKPFTPDRTNLKRGGGKYCSIQCVGQAKSVPLLNRFWQKIQRCDHGTNCIYCCWPWLAAFNEHGYGVISIKNAPGITSPLAHRISWELWNKRQVPPELHVNHHCDCPPCCSPMHLYCGTQEENMHDAARRHRTIQGEQCIQAKLCEQDIPHIFQMHAQGMFLKDIATHFSVNRATIGDVVNHRTWKHVSLLLTAG